MTLSHLKKEESNDRTPVETATTSLPQTGLRFEEQVELSPVVGDGGRAGEPVRHSGGGPLRAVPAPGVLNFPQDKF